MSDTGMRYQTVVSRQVMVAMSYAIALNVSTDRSRVGHKISLHDVKSCNRRHRLLYTGNRQEEEEEEKKKKKKEENKEVGRRTRKLYVRTKHTCHVFEVLYFTQPANRYLF
jgi:hypothetical protein